MTTEKKVIIREEVQEVVEDSGVVLEVAVVLKVVVVPEVVVDSEVEEVSEGQGADPGVIEVDLEVDLGVVEVDLGVVDRNVIEYAVDELLNCRIK